MPRSEEARSKGADTGWKDKWQGERFLRVRHAKFEIMDEHVVPSPRSILDIGCGLAIESELFQKRHGTDLYLLDGDSEGNGGDQSRDVGYGESDSMQFYLSRRYLEDHWSSRGMKYEFIDAKSPVIDAAMKFDLICSSKSCGFHYPLSTYRELILAHSAPHTRLIFDLRKTDAVLGDDTYEVVHQLIEWEKGITAEIRFV